MKTKIGRHRCTPLSRWRHVKTNSTYTVLGIGQCSTNGIRENKEESVIYWSDSYQALRYREISEFLDGRFVPLDDKGVPFGN